MPDTGRTGPIATLSPTRQVLQNRRPPAATSSRDRRVQLGASSSVTGAPAAIFARAFIT